MANGRTPTNATVVAEATRPRVVATFPHGAVAAEAAKAAKAKAAKAKHTTVVAKAASARAATVPAIAERSRNSSSHSDLHQLVHS